MIYNYEITKVDAENKHMEVTFSATGEESFTTGMPIPEVGVDLKSHLNTYAPVPLWKQRTATVQSVSVGDSGEIDSDNPEGLEA